MRSTANSILIALLMVLALNTQVFAENANKACRGTFVSFDDFAYEGMGPLKFSGMNLAGKNPDLPDQGNTLQNPICACQDANGQGYFGIVFSYWEINKLLISRKNAYCDPVTGMDFNIGTPGSLTGAFDVENGTHHSFSQTGLADFPFNRIMGIGADIQCMQQQGDFDFLSMSELDPTEQVDFLTALVWPVTFLGAIPFADLSCAPANLMSVMRQPPTMFPFCAWGLIFPLNGSKDGSNKLEANAANAAKIIFKHTAEGLLQDMDSNVCSQQYRPLWNPGKFRLSMMRPTKSRAFIINDPVSLWGSGKNNALGTNKGGPDDFLFAMYQKRSCCEKIR